MLECDTEQRFTRQDLQIASALYLLTLCEMYVATHGSGVHFDIIPAEAAV